MSKKDTSETGVPVVKLLDHFFHDLDRTVRTCVLSLKFWAKSFEFD